ncbi:MAG: serine/threonine protein kinase, partial [Caldilineaceae bacterium]|nr:serine/threonine protein kinase [Caldilineaceae bacterium]
YLVMAFVEGDDLGKVLAQRGQPFEQDEIGRYGMQLARVLDYLADRNPPVMHRDIKPGNIILEKTTGQLKLVDFGIARDSLGSENLEATASIVMGTRGYAPPEQFAGKATPTSDIYAMGATLHHLATDQHPLKASVPFQFASVRTIRPDFSPALDALVLEMVRIDPAQRPNAAELKKRFERISGTQVAQNAFVMRNGAEVFSAGELVQACERSPETGRYHLVQGHIRDWFLSQKRHDLAGWADECVAEAPDDR